MQTKHKTRKRRAHKLKDQNVGLSASAAASLYNLTDSIENSGFAADYLIQSYLSKYADPDPSMTEERRNAAIRKWLETEEHNRRTNHRLSMLPMGYNVLPRVTFKRFIGRARSYVRTILGPLHDDVMLGGFSGGASTGHRRARAHPGFKFTDKAEVSESAEHLIDPLWRLAPFLRQHTVFSRPKAVKGAVLFTVPKNSDIDRCACKEPEVNMYLQKGVGRHIRRRLRNFGVNLNDQSVNSDLARLGSLSGDLATLDLSSASDTVSIATVRLLLPQDWFLYLNDIRSHSVLVEDTYVTTAMFSSMGNGFTFELESLLFYVLCKTVLYFEGIAGRISVYGDDIICPTRGYESIVWVLHQFGFIPNLEKSYSTGAFRESCGGHYHNGLDVTPFRLKRPAERLTDLIRVANQLRKWAIRTSPTSHGIIWAPEDITSLWIRLRDMVPRVLWGGYDLDLDTQLVTAGPPNKRLARVQEKIRVPSKGLYTQWHNSHWNRTHNPNGNGEGPRQTLEVCRMRRATNQGDPKDKPIFDFELGL